MTASRAALQKAFSQLQKRFPAQSCRSVLGWRCGAASPDRAFVLGAAKKGGRRLLCGTKLPFIHQSPSTNFAAMAHMTNAMPASKIRQADGLAKIGRSHAEP